MLTQVISLTCTLISHWNSRLEERTHLFLIHSTELTSYIDVVADSVANLRDSICSLTQILPTIHSTYIVHSKVTGNNIHNTIGLPLMGDYNTLELFRTIFTSSSLLLSQTIIDCGPPA